VPGQNGRALLLLEEELLLTTVVVAGIGSRLSQMDPDLGNIPKMARPLY